MQRNKMSKEEFLYRAKYLNWHLLPLPPMKYKDHVLVIRILKDDLGKLYGDRILRYDAIIDGVTGPDAELLDRLIEILRNEADLKWAEHILEKNIKMRRIEE